MSGKNAVVLLSGGLDSTTVLAIARSEGYVTHALSFQYGQRHMADRFQLVIEGRREGDLAKTGAGRVENGVTDGGGDDGDRGLARAHLNDIKQVDQHRFHFRQEHPEFIHRVADPIHRRK